MLRITSQYQRLRILLLIGLDSLSLPKVPFDDTLITDDLRSPHAIDLQFNDKSNDSASFYHGLIHDNPLVGVSGGLSADPSADRQVPPAKHFD